MLLNSVMIRDVDVTAALDMPGVCDYVGASDVPGKNTIGPIFYDEEVFASKEVVHHGN